MFLLVLYDDSHSVYLSRRIQLDVEIEVLEPNAECNWKTRKDRSGRHLQITHSQDYELQSPSILHA